MVRTEMRVYFCGDYRLRSVIVYLGRERPEDDGQELRPVWEFNPLYRGRRLWRIWQHLPAVFVSRWGRSTPPRTPERPAPPTP